jgi:RHS repeat-associated protein
MLDEVGIIHMNGRLYDPEIGRMLGPDPVVQSPENCQNYNAYAYVLNNPMRFTDPSGYFSVGKLLKKGTRALKKVGKWFKKGYNWKEAGSVS